MAFQSQEQTQRYWAKVFDYLPAYEAYRAEGLKVMAKERPNWPQEHLAWFMDKQCWLKYEKPIIAYETPDASYPFSRPKIIRVSEALAVLSSPPEGPLLAAKDLPIRTFGDAPFHDYDTILHRKALLFGQEKLVKMGWNGAGLGRVRKGRCDPVEPTGTGTRAGIGYTQGMPLLSDNRPPEVWNPRLGIKDNGYRRESQRINYVPRDTSLPPPTPPPPSFYLQRRLQQMLELQQPPSDLDILTMDIPTPAPQPEAPHSTSKIHLDFVKLFTENIEQTECTIRILEDYFHVSIHINEDNVIIGNGKETDRARATNFVSWWMRLAVLRWEGCRPFPYPCHLLGKKDVRDMFL